MLLEEFGASLRSLRQSRGLQLEDVARHIKLPERTLASIEEGREKDLPHTVYAKGFIRTYAKFLGMPDEEISTALNAVFPVDESEEMAPPITLIKHRRRGSGRLGTIFILLLLAALAIGGWYVYTNVIYKNTEQPAVPVTTSRSSDSAAPSAESYDDFVLSESSQNSSSHDEMHNQANSQADNVGQDNHAVADTSDVEGPVFFDSDANVGGSDTGNAVEADKKHRVVVTATEECWLKAKTDSGDERQFNLPKNQSSVFTFDKSLKLRLGNAAGVKIRYNGRDFPVPDGPGNTRDLFFPPKDS